MRVLHLIHGLYGKNNGVDIYIRNFIEASEGIFENILAVPAGKNSESEDIKTEIIELNSLYELEDIVKDFNIDILLIHWTGSECFAERKDIVRFRDNLISISNTPVYTGNLDMNPNAYPDSAMLWNPTERKHKVYILSHACFELPDYIQDFIDGMISVSQEAKKSNINIRPNDCHEVIYPSLSKELEDELITKEVDEKEIVIGWLGTLNKINSNSYAEIKKVYGNQPGIKFLFAGKGINDLDAPSNFEFTGVMNSKDFFKKIDIFFYPTSIDSFSLSLLEAMSQNKLCLVSDVVKELASFGDCYIFKNECEMLDILQILISNPKLISKVENTREIILKRFSSKRMIEEFQKIFSKSLVAKI